jgi:glucose/mannose-6-phosphate isomerase
VDTTVIESVERIRAADPGNMLERIKDLPKQVRDAWKIASAAQLPPAHGDVRNITVAGRGGAAIGGDLAAASLAGVL